MGSLEHLNAALRHVDRRNQQPRPRIAEPGALANDALDLVPQHGAVVFRVTPLEQARSQFGQAASWRLSPGKYLLTVVEEHFLNRFGALAESQSIHSPRVLERER